MADELFDLRNSVALGNFHQAVAEGSQIKVSGRPAAEISDIHAERDYLISRAQVGLGQFDAATSEHQNASHPLLKAAHAWANFHKGADRDGALKALQLLVGFAKPGTPGTSSTIVGLLAACHLHLNDVQASLAVVGNWIEALSKEKPMSGTGVSEALLTRQGVELRSIMVEGLLRMYRVDLADKILNDMRALDDDAVLTILAGVSVALATGSPDRIAEAKSLVQDLSARCGQSISLLNIAGVAALLSGQQSDAEQCFVSALAKKSSEVDTLSNLAAVAASSKAQEAFAKVYAQAHAANSEAAWTKNYAAAQKRFAEAVDAFKAAA